MSLEELQLHIRGQLAAELSGAESNEEGCASVFVSLCVRDLTFRTLASTEAAPNGLFKAARSGIVVRFCPVRQLEWQSSS